MVIGRTESLQSQAVTAADVPAPDGVTAVPDRAGDPLIGWAGVSGAASYDIYRDGTRIATGVTSTSYDDTAVPDCNPHNYAVTAVIVGTESVPSATVQSAAHCG